MPLWEKITSLDVAVKVDEILKEGDGMSREKEGFPRLTQGVKGAG